MPPSVFMEKGSFFMPAQNELETRRAALLKRFIAANLTDDLYGAKALCNLALNEQIAESNQKLRDVAQWYVLPHPKGRDPYGESDFVGIKLVWAYYRFGNSGLLEAETMTAIREYFLTYDFQSKYTSENHQLLFHTSRYLMACAYPDDIFGRYGMTGRQLEKIELEYLLSFIQFRAKRGWDEFDSGCYLAPGFECLLALCDFAPDPRLALGARMMLNVRLLDLAHESLEGMYCGAHGRIYEKHALDHRNECSFFLQELYFGNVTCYDTVMVIEALLSNFKPEPIVGRILTGRTAAYDVRERDHLHCSTYRAPERPLKQQDGSIRKITSMTPDYALGTVQWSDEYEPGSLAEWRSGHQQMDWDLTFAGGDTRRRVFTQHPGHNGAEGAEHGYWTGDLFCNCSCHFQNGPVHLSLYDIPEREPYHWIHAYFPEALFDTVLKEDDRFYAASGNTCFVLRFSAPIRFVTDGEWAGREVICEGRKVAVALEVGLLSEFGSLENFRLAMQRNEMRFNSGAMRLEYVSPHSGALTLSRKERLIDGQPARLDYATYDSPYLYAPWDGGGVKAMFGGEETTFDFVSWENKTIPHNIA